jgi:putative solute:sodium symporter small subunit
MAQLDRETYWRKQLQRTIILLVVWFVVGYLMSIFLIEPLNTINFGGIPFGFWMAQQGSIFVFISLIFIYAYFTGRLDKQAGLAESDDATSTPGAAH